MIITKDPQKLHSSAQLKRVEIASDKHDRRCCNIQADPHIAFGQFFSSFVPQLTDWDFFALGKINSCARLSGFFFLVKKKKWKRKVGGDHEGNFLVSDAIVWRKIVFHIAVADFSLLLGISWKFSFLSGFWVEWRRSFDHVVHVLDAAARFLARAKVQVQGAVTAAGQEEGSLRRWVCECLPVQCFFQFSATRWQTKSDRLTVDDDGFSSRWLSK